MSLIDDNIVAFSQFSQRAQDDFIEMLLSEYEAGNEQYINDLLGISLTDQLLEEFGMADAIDAVIGDYNSIANNVLLGAFLLPAAIEVLKELDTLFWSQHIAEIAIKTKRSLILASISGTSKAGVKELLIDSTRGLSEKQMLNLSGTIMNDFQAGIFAEATKNIKDARFTYAGPIDGKNRPVCADVLSRPQNSAEGFTRDEISRLPVDFVFRGGINCRHSFVLVSQ